MTTAATHVATPTPISPAPRRLAPLDAESREQLHGRFIEVVDLRAAITRGEFASLAALAAHLTDLEARMQRTLQQAYAGAPVGMQGCCFTLDD
ncbi:hypothetical protein [Cupriavidus sp. TMH.W2]|uniref:hypothetical protein n=1 Tax=Cupriavidus sp. TMH.W2 TaxID=3434465 RepID=UPI003D780CD3